MSNMDKTETALASLIANFAVVEQIVINLTHMVSRGFDDGRSVRSHIVDDVRFRLESLQRKPGRDSQMLACLALDHLDRLEPRLLGDAGEDMMQ